ncbi:MAG: hypothetical protein M3436_18405 [Pseudomonadota bacterium]|nr:hypothetical protein [Pseudomonadota bacterium]
MELFLLFAFFLAGFIVFMTLMILDARTLIIRPPKLTVAEGSADSDSPANSATHEEDTTSGRIKVSANVTGAGRAQATSLLGHEFETKAKKPGRYYVVGVYDYRSRLNVAPTGGQAKIMVELRINSKTKTIAQAAQNSAGNKLNPASGEFASITKKHLISLQPGQQCKASLAVTAVAEGAQGNENANCVAEATLKIKEIQLRPSVFNLLVIY